MISKLKNFSLEGVMARLSKDDRQAVKVATTLKKQIEARRDPKAKVYDKDQVTTDLVAAEQKLARDGVQIQGPEHPPPFKAVFDTETRALTAVGAYLASPKKSEDRDWLEGQLKVARNDLRKTALENVDWRRVEDAVRMYRAACPRNATHPVERARAPYYASLVHRALIGQPPASEDANNIVLSVNPEDPLVKMGARVNTLMHLAIGRAEQSRGSEKARAEFSDTVIGMGDLLRAAEGRLRVLDEISHPLRVA